ncbi:MAG: hypothetical protein HY043_06630 [Verrucomicrobia bacterium]|nr:hypothetical protein [Verrucomicrobiota bacterium]
MQEEHSIADLCDALAVSRSGYHAWAARVPGPSAQADARFARAGSILLLWRAKWAIAL